MPNYTIWKHENINGKLDESGKNNTRQVSSDQSKIYVVSAAYDANWNLSGAVNIFDVAAKTFFSESLISNISGPKGLAVNPKDGNIYLFTGETITGAGLMKIYKPSGEIVKQEAVGASPTMAIFLK